MNGVCTNTVVLVFLRFGMDGITMGAEGVLRSWDLLSPKIWSKFSSAEMNYVDMVLCLFISKALSKERCEKGRCEKDGANV